MDLWLALEEPLDTDRLVQQAVGHQQQQGLGTHIRNLCPTIEGRKRPAPGQTENKKDGEPATAASVKIGRHDERENDHEEQR